MFYKKEALIVFLYLIIFISFVGLVYAVSSDSTSLDEWNMFRRTLNHTGFYPGDVNLTGFGLKWISNIGGDVFSSPIIKGDILYVGSNDYNLYALNATTGIKIWNYSTGDLVQGSPAIAGDTMLIGSSDYNLYALNATTGIKIWNYSTGDEIASSPAVVDGVVFIGSNDHNLYALNFSTGSHIWNFTAAGGFSTSSPAVINEVLYTANFESMVYALYASNGSKIWNYSLDSFTYSSPAVAYGQVYIPSGAGKIYALNATTGTKVWNYSAGSQSFASPSVAKGRVYILNDYLYILNATDGTLLLKEFQLGNAGWPSPVVSNNSLICGGAPGAFFMLNESDGALLKFYHFDARGASPSITNGVVYSGDYNQRLFALTDGQIPEVSFVNPSVVSRSYNQHSIWANVSAFDPNDNLANITIYLSNTGGLINSSMGSGPSLFVNFTDLDQGVYYLNITANDTLGNNAETDYRVITLTTQVPEFSSMFLLFLAMIIVISGIAVIRKKNN